MSNVEQLFKYKEKFNEVEGWCSGRLFDVFAEIIKVNGVSESGIAEIGVHHGKFFLMLNALTTGNSTSFAIDVFEDQKLNIDFSGSGSSSIFKENLRKFDAHGGSNVQIIAGDSTDPALKLRDKIGLGALSFISIDGGHTAEHTISDLYLAQDLISNSGLVILDDILNYHWLGVIEGVSRFLQGYPCLIPVALGDNKLFMAKLSYRDLYFDIFKSLQFASKEVKFFGHQLVAL